MNVMLHEQRINNLKCDDCGTEIPKGATKCKCGFEPGATLGGNRIKSFPKPNKFCQWSGGPIQNCPMLSQENNAITHHRWYCRFHARFEGEEQIKFWYLLNGKLKGRANELHKFFMAAHFKTCYWDDNGLLRIDWEIKAQQIKNVPQWVRDGIQTMEKLLKQDTNDNEKSLINFGDKNANSNNE